MAPRAALREGLRTRAEFERVQHGPDARLKYSRFLLLAARSESASRFGFVASKKVGNAVLRNRCKRLLRESVRGTTPPANVDIVLIAYPSLTTATLADVLPELTSAMEALARVLSRKRRKDP